MVAGDSLQASTIFNNAKERARQAGKKKTIKEIAEVISEEYKRQLRKNIETGVLNPFGLNYDTYKEALNTFPSWISVSIFTSIKNYDFEEMGVEFLIFGLDEGVPHIYSVGIGGKIDCHDHIGFAIIGSGRRQALSEMTKYPYSPDIHFLESIRRIYYSKKSSERARGVGKETDLLVLHSMVEKEKITPVLFIPDKDIFRSLDMSIEGTKSVEESAVQATLKSLEREFDKYVKREEKKK